VDDKGNVGMYVEECNRSWCTSSNANDQRAVTIETASDTAAPYAVTDGALAGLIRLCADICKRNGIKKLVWSTDKNARINHLNGCNMTVHRDYANKSCPGDYLYGKHGYIAEEVNKLLGSAANTSTPPSQPSPPAAFAPYVVRVTADTLNYRSGAGTNYKINGTVKKGEAFTIVAESDGAGASKWGKLKSGAGWISLDYAVKV
jgi:SH3-like domain-containing protein